ncbi:MAG: universal stress protein [Nitrosopumilus sp.]|uniref:universal stress protein n=1 Tax=Nitrosopumilus sp. TaxID=2024843 RepID=UPI00247B72C9|nr:universal stress protein [Nitrosopumilus sp.]MCV0393156.1 universal stress protein [Nitrosopumilus sp.]
MSKNFEEILVPFNGTDGSQKAFKKAVAIAGLEKSKITILTCIEERATFGLFKTKTNKQEFEKEKSQIKSEHDKLQEYAKKSDVSVNSEIIISDRPALTILEYADKHNVDIIILGKRKLTKFEKIHFPSTIEDIVKNFHGAVLILN